MKAGIASGAAVSTAHIRRPGRCVRSTNQAAAVPTTAQTSVADTVINSVLISSSPTSGRKIRSTASARPKLAARQKVNAIGSSTSKALSAAAANNPRGARKRARAGAGVTAGGPADTASLIYSKPAWRSSLPAWLSSPSCWMVSAGGFSSANGLRIGSDATPARSGYSNMTWLFAINCWARSLTR